MNILGISAFYHDSAACLLQDGKLVAAGQEERFTRIKHDADFPKQAVEFCLKQAGITVEEIDLVAYYEKPFLKFERIVETIIENAPFTYDFAIKALPVWMKQKLWMRKTLQKELGKNIPVIFTGHHESHAASSFFPSPFNEAATLTVDGVGEWSTTSWGIGKGNRLTLQAEIRFPHSLGMLYSAVTQYLGFRVNSAEYKVMGLAPYGEPKYAQILRENLIEIFEDGSYLLNLEYFNFHKKREMIHPKFEALFGMPIRQPESKIEPFHADVARSLQVVTEEVMLKLARHVKKETGLKNLCLAGGVALNCVANGKILKEGIFDRIWIQPAAGDAGGAVGAAYIGWHHFKDQPRSCAHPDHQAGSYLGPQFEEEEIEQSMEQYGVKYRRYSEEQMIRRTAELLAEQKVVGWFQGRMEFGPRALGNRSILGDARNPEMQKRMNLKIKFRESFRPFAPSFLEEDTDQYFDLRGESPYMLLTCELRKFQRPQRRTATEKWMSEMLSDIPSDIPAVTHVDGSARTHTVAEKTNPLFYNLIRTFKEITGSSVLINTSFNVRGEPIVCNPNDAIRCFIKTDIDVLVVGPYVIEREFQDSVELNALRTQLHKEDPLELD